MYPYLNFLLLFFGLPILVLGWRLRSELRRYPRTLAWCFGFVFTVGWFWDWLSWRTGVWRYDTAPTVGWWIGGLPVEEFIGFYVLGTLLIVLVSLAFLRRARRV
jgi:lycopene cyclase domain-containing protein